VSGVKIVPAQAQSVGHAGSPAFHQHICCADQAQKALGIAILSQVEEDAALSTVKDGVGGGALLSRRIAAGRLNPDHVGAIVRQNSGRPGPGCTPGAIDDG
jgi:hypothetical protein